MSVPRFAWSDLRYVELLPLFFGCTITSFFKANHACSATRKYRCDVWNLGHGYQSRLASHLSSHSMQPWCTLLCASHLTKSRVLLEWDEAKKGKVTFKLYPHMQMEKAVEGRIVSRSNVTVGRREKERKHGDGRKCGCAGRRGGEEEGGEVGGEEVEVE